MSATAGRAGSSAARPCRRRGSPDGRVPRSAWPWGSSRAAGRPGAGGVKLGGAPAPRIVTASASDANGGVSRRRDERAFVGLPVGDSVSADFLFLLLQHQFVNDVAH